MYINNLMQLLFKDKLELEQENNRLIKEIKNYMKAFDDLINKRISKRATRILQEKYQLPIDKYNLGISLDILKGDLEVLQLTYELNKKKLENTSMIILYIKYKQIISPALMDFIQKRLGDANFTNVDIINTMEFIKVHNANAKKDIDFRISNQDLFFIINMLNQGYEEITLPDYEDKEKFDGVILNCINLIDNNSSTVIDNALNIDTLYSEEELTYIYTYLLKHYQDELLSLIDVLKDKDFYFNISILEDIKNEYKKIYQKYMYIRKKLDKTLEDTNIDSYEIGEEDFEENKALNLYYASNNNDPTKCYFVKDLMDLREEALPKILTLLEEFQMGKTTRIKVLKELDKCIELKDDQIRIVLRPIGNKNYIVLGVFIKKDDNDRKSYVNIINRREVILDDNYSKEVENFYNEYIKNNGRTGSR